MPCTKGLVVVFIAFLNIWYTCYCSEGKVFGFHPGKEGYHLTEDMADQVPFWGQG